MANDHIFEVFELLLSMKQLHNTCMMANVFQDLTIVSLLLKRACTTKTVKLMQNLNRKTKNSYFASADKLSAVIMVPCSITEITGVIDSPNALINAAR